MVHTKTKGYNSVVIKLNEDSSFFCEREKISKLSGVADPRSIYRLLTKINLDANPRKAKVSRVTREIEETLKDNSLHYRDLSKGILMAANDLEELDRNRWQLFFADLTLEGVLDGGHNLLSIGRHFISLACDESVLARIKKWEDLQLVIAENAESIERILDECSFEVPIEVIVPGSAEGAIDEWPLLVQDISQARNNNAELKLVTKANYQGLFDYQKKHISENLHGDIEWKTGEGGHISPTDLAMLALIPLSLFSEDFGAKINPTTLYSSKGRCLELYENILKDPEVSKLNGKNYEIFNPKVESALAIGLQLISVYERLYMKLPQAYNDCGGKFGGIDGVQKAGGEKKIKPKTKFLKRDCDYRYPDGFIYPLLWAMKDLLKAEDDKISWKHDPESFISQKLVKIMSRYKGLMALAQLNPQKVGKSPTLYANASDYVKLELLAMQEVVGG